MDTRPGPRTELPHGPLRGALLAAALLACAAPAAWAQAPPLEGGPGRYVIHISVDGLRPDAITRYGPDRLPNFHRLRAEGAFTDNARTDYDYGKTLPNHISQLTGRPVLGPDGHLWTDNEDAVLGATLHSQRGGYVAAVFDVVHDSGRRTAAYVSKPKFDVFERSYSAAHGAPDTTGVDDGRDKIDRFVYDPDTRALVDTLVHDFQEAPPAYTFLHLRDPDHRGHWFGWRLWWWHPYMNAVRRADRLLGQVLDLVEQDPRLAGQTIVILTADHGGSRHNHYERHPLHYTVPFYVWGAGVPPGDLYRFNADQLLDPGRDRPGFDAPIQPVRNGSAANLALALLGLGPVPGSTINAASQMRVAPPAAPPAGRP